MLSRKGQSRKPQRDYDNPGSSTHESGQSRVDLSLNRSVLHHLSIHSDRARCGEGLQPQSFHFLIHQVGAAARQVGTFLHSQEEAEKSWTGDSSRHVEQMNQPIVRHRSRDCPQVLSQVGLVDSKYQNKVLLLDHCPGLRDWLIHARKEGVHWCSGPDVTLCLRSLGSDRIVGGVGDGVVVGDCAVVIAAGVLVRGGVGNELTGE